jgi:hypothetical protein
VYKRKQILSKQLEYQANKTYFIIRKRK